VVTCHTFFPGYLILSWIKHFSFYFNGIIKTSAILEAVIIKCLIQFELAPFLNIFIFVFKSSINMSQSSNGYTRIILCINQHIIVV